MRLPVLPCLPIVGTLQERAERAHVWLLVGGTLTIGSGALAQHPAENGSLRAAHVKAALHQILSDPEFQPPGKTENVVTRTLRWIGEEWQNFKHMLRDLWNALFGVASALHGTPALQWLFIVVFLAIGTYVLFRLIRTLIAQARMPKHHTSQPHVEKEAPDESLDPAEWMERARLASLEKDYRSAYRAVYRATILQLNRAALVTYHPAHTNHEILETLSPPQRSSVGENLSHFTQAFETRWFGSTTTQSQDYEHSLNIATQIQQMTSNEDNNHALPRQN